MPKKRLEITKAIELLTSNLSEIARVDEWANYMGYKSPQRFGHKFIRQFKVRPCKMMIYIRLSSISEYLRSNNDLSNFEIAIAHSLPDEKALNSFTKYHLGCSPTRIKCMPIKELENKMEKFGIKIMD
jgi:AraC-like DNA-binding protein